MRLPIWHVVLLYLCPRSVIYDMEANEVGLVY